MLYTKFECKWEFFFSEDFNLFEKDKELNEITNATNIWNKVEIPKCVHLLCTNHVCDEYFGSFLQINNEINRSDLSFMSPLYS